MRSRLLFGACAALAAVACGSSPGNGLFGEGHDNLPVVGPDAGDPEPGAGGKVSAGSGGRSAGGRPAGGIGGVEPTAGGSQGNGGASGRSNPGGGAAGQGGAGETGGSGGDGTPGAGGAAGSDAGGSAGEGTGGKLTGSGGSASAATPHTVACGATVCPVGSALTSACCVSELALATVCIPTLGAGCANAGVAVTCDDAADCTGSEICCADSVANAQVTVCAKECKDGVAQLCRTDDECKSGGGCEPIMDQPAYSHCK